MYNLPTTKILTLVFEEITQYSHTNTQITLKLNSNGKTEIGGNCIKCRVKLSYIYIF